MPVLDIADRVVAGGEQGLLGLALHPDFRANGRLFVNYTRAVDGATIIASSASGPTASPTLRPSGCCWSSRSRTPTTTAACIAFDAQGMLLIGMGDGGSGGDPEGNGQDPTALLGKILRIDVDGAEPYAIPADNPFAGGAEPGAGDLGAGRCATRGACPWTVPPATSGSVTWARATGRRSTCCRPGPRGANLGWNTMEGDVCFEAEACDQEGLTLPVATISHDDGACSVIGGYVYRGTTIPSLVGGYLFTDLCAQHPVGPRRGGSDRGWKREPRGGRGGDRPDGQLR